MKSAILFTGILILFQCKSQQPSATTVSLENPHWKLVEAGGKKILTPPGGKEVYMQLVRQGDTGMLKGYAGCNGLGGDYQTDGRTIRFQPITTRMYCNLQMDTETAFTRMLAIADRYRIRGHTLELFAADELLGKFEAITISNGN